MNNCDLLCEIEKLSNHIECLEYEKWDVMWQNGKYKKQLKNKNDKIKKLKKQLDQQKAMWQKLKEWLDRILQLYLNDSDKETAKLISEILDKMQELEAEDE